MTEYIVCPYCHNPLSQDKYVEVVRCRDCAFYEPDGISSAVYPDRFWCVKMLHYMQPDGFCAWASRRES